MNFASKKIISLREKHIKQKKGSRESSSSKWLVPPTPMALSFPVQITWMFRCTWINDGINHFYNIQLMVHIEYIKITCAFDLHQEIKHSTPAHILEMWNICSNSVCLHKDWVNNKLCYIKIFTHTLCLSLKNHKAKSFLY